MLYSFGHLCVDGHKCKLFFLITNLTFFIEADITKKRIQKILSAQVNVIDGIDDSS